jgi:predicted secreted protein
MKKMIAAMMVAAGLSLGLAQPAFAAPAAKQCADAQTAINNLRLLAAKYPKYASYYTAMADSEARAARVSGCTTVV